MGVLFNVLFKPVSPGNMLTAVNNRTTATPPDDEQVPPPEWSLDRRDDGALVWRRYGESSSASPRGRRRVEFLDAVQVRVYERDDVGGGDRDVKEEDDEDDQPFWADDWTTSWDDEDPKTLFYGQPDQCEYPVLVVVSVTVVGLCIGVGYMFAPVRWLFHQLLVD